jgi:large subunit ribosomal protein L14e
MPSHYVKLGRVVRILRGPRQNKIGVITAIIDANRVLVENPKDSKMWRHVQNMKNIEPLKFNVRVGTNARTKDIAAQLDAKKTLEKIAKTHTGKKIAASANLAASTDFDRYLLRVAKRSRAFHARKIFTEADQKGKLSFNQRTVAKLEKASKKYLAKNAARQEKYAAKLAKKAAARKAKKTA